jgi:hypothetical protein
MLTRKILGLAAGIALMTSFAIAPAAYAVDDSVTVDASTADVVELTLNTHNVDFGDDLNFQGENAGANTAVCNLSGGGVSYVQYPTPVSATVASNHNYTLDLNATANDFPSGSNHNKLKFQTTTPSCATIEDPGVRTNVNISVAHDLHTGGADPATAGTTYDTWYSFDVPIEYTADAHQATIQYTLTQV